MIKTGIIGATGYAGQQLVSLLINHPEAEVTFVSSNSYAGQSFSDIYPQFYRILDQKLLSTEEAKAAIGDVDVVFTALPNGLVFEIAEIAMEKGTKIVDFSADLRLDDPEVYEEWYKTKHTAPQLVSRQVYGLPELWRDRIRNAQLVADPGCYTTASILAVSALPREKRDWRIKSISSSMRNRELRVPEEKQTSLCCMRRPESQLRLTASQITDIRRRSSRNSPKWRVRRSASSSPRI